MNTYTKIFTVVVASLFLFSCDKEENPMYPRTPFCELIEQYHPNPSSIDCDNYVYPTFKTNTNSDRTIVIEDFTGHFCSNCPNAAITAKAIEASNPERVFTLTIHSGGSSNSFQYTTSHYTTDFTTQAGLDYSVDIPGFFGNPSGMISRTYPSGSSSLWLFETSWNAHAQSILAENDHSVNIQIEDTLYQSTEGLFVHYEVEAAKDLDENTKVIVLLVERKVVAPQTMNDGSTDDLYEHHNVLSGAVNSSYGDAIGALSAGEKYQGLVINGLSKISTNRVVNKDKGNDLSIMALVVNGKTHEVYQVAFKDINF